MTFKAELHQNRQSLSTKDLKLRFLATFPGLYQKIVITSLSTNFAAVKPLTAFFHDFSIGTFAFMFLNNTETYA